MSSFFKLLAPTPKSSSGKRLVVYGVDTYDVWTQEPARVLKLCFYTLLVILKITEKSNIFFEKVTFNVTFSKENVTFSGKM